MCRYSADGTPLLLKAFFESANPALNFQFHFKEKPGQLNPLEEECDRRVIGKRVSVIKRKKGNIFLNEKCHYLEFLT